MTVSQNTIKDLGMKLGGRILQYMHKSMGSFPGAHPLTHSDNINLKVSIQLTVKLNVNTDMGKYK